MAIPPGELNSGYTRLGAATGRLIKESGDSINEADIREQEWLSDVAMASREGTLYRGFWQGAVALGTTETFVLDVPSGIDLIGFIRNSQARESTIITRFLSVTGFTSAEGPFDGLSLDRREGRRSVSQAKLHRASSVSGRIVHSPDVYMYVGDSQAARSPSVQSESGAQPAFDSTELAAFEYQNDTAADAQLALYLFWQELPNG